jgi:predicted DNA-binding antitoxin AbrB/MazE fold protein
MLVKQSVRAVFEHGTFRPLMPLREPIPEGRQVEIVVATNETAEDVLKLAAKVYEGFSAEEVCDIERLALDRRNFFDARRLS